jgi:hypothetical protein
MGNGLIQFRGVIWGGGIFSVKISIGCSLVFHSRNTMSFSNTAAIAHEVSPSTDLRWPLHGRPLSGANKYFDWVETAMEA